MKLSVHFTGCYPDVHAFDDVKGENEKGPPEVPVHPIATYDGFELEE